MRRRFLAACLAAALAACGGDDDNGGNGGDGGNGGNGGDGGNANASVAVTGANTFTATNAIGFSTATPITCVVESASVSTSIIAVFMTDVAGDVCSLVNANQEKRGAGGVGLVIVSGNVIGAAPPPLGPGAYPVTSSGSLPLPDPEGNITFVAAFAAKNAPGTCGATDVEAESGTITITSVSGGVISGSVDANLSAAGGGGRIAGTFTTSACALPAANACSEIIDDSPDVCVD